MFIENYKYIQNTRLQYSFIIKSLQYNFSHVITNSMRCLKQNKTKCDKTLKKFKIREMTVNVM